MGMTKGNKFSGGKNHAENICSTFGRSDPRSRINPSLSVEEQKG